MPPHEPRPTAVLAALAASLGLDLSEPVLTPAESDARCADAVAAFLRAHPDFLAERADLYRSLAPPRRVHGEALADHMAAMLHAERDHAEAMSARADAVLASGRAAAGLTGRVHEAVLALLRADRVAECVTLELPALLRVDGASLCMEGTAHRDARPLPDGTVGRLLGGRTVCFRTAAGDARLLHGEAAGLARTDALVRVPWHGAAAMLALVTRDDAALDPGQGTGALAFLGRAVGAALGR